MDNWKRAALLTEIKDDCGLAVNIDGHAIAIVRVDGQIYAVDDTCTHADASLCDGMLDGDELECPLHFARFNVKTGAVTADPAKEPLKTYGVRIINGVIEVDFS